MSQILIKPPWPTTGYVTTAKAFNNGDDPTDYYRKSETVDEAFPDPKTWEGGLIPSTGSGDTYEKMTLVFCINPQTHDPDAIFIFGSTQSNFTVATWDENGGLWIGGKDWTGGIHTAHVEAANFPMEVDGWHTVMIAYNGDSGESPEQLDMVVWANGEEVYNGLWGTSGQSASMHPMDWQGPCYVGLGDFPFGNCGGTDPDQCAGLDCYLSYVWCNEEYLDPAVYWDSFFDANNKPKDIGADGSGVTGSAPVSFFPDADFTNNRGTGTGWLEVGSVPDAPSSPTD